MYGYIFLDKSSLYVSVLLSYFYFSGNNWRTKEFGENLDVGCFSKTVVPNCGGKFDISIIVWPWLKVKGHQTWLTHTCNAHEDSSHAKFEESRYHSLRKISNVRFQSNFSVCQLVGLERKYIDKTGLGDMHFDVLFYVLYIQSFILMTQAILEIPKLLILYKCWLCDLCNGQKSPAMA